MWQTLTSISSTIQAKEKEKQFDWPFGVGPNNPWLWCDTQKAHREVGSRRRYCTQPPFLVKRREKEYIANDTNNVILHKN